MNIKNQIRLSVLISLILVMVISVSIVVSYQNMQDLRAQEALAADVVKGGYELTYLSNDYLINAEPRARIQWEERYTSLQPIISQLKPGNEEEAQNLAIIRDYNEKVGTLFREIPEPGTLSTGAVLFPASFQQITWSRINVQSQGMIYEAWQLRHMYNDDVSDARFWNNILVVVLMVLMLIIIGVNYLLISRRLVRAIREVNTGSEVFATGNLDYRIPVTGDDEIGGIAHRLNAMAEQIRSVTASRDELDREVDQRRRVEESIKRSEIRYRRLFESAKDGILILNRDTGEIFDANPFIETLLGYAPKDLLGKHLWDIGLLKDQIISKIAFEDLQAKEYLRYEDLPLETKDGRRIEVEFISNVYSLDSHTSVIQCNIRDITDRKLTDEALRETNEYLQNLLNYANAPIIVWDREFRITRFNHAFEHLTGRTEQDVVGQHLSLLFPDASRITSLEQIQKTLAGERWETVEIPIQHLSGETRIVLWNSANIVDPQGVIISTIAQGIDITERKQAIDGLRESEVSFRVLSENLPGIVYRIHLQENNRMVFFNDQLKVLSGYSSDELGFGKLCSIEPHIHPDDLPRVLAVVDKAVGECTTFIVEYRFQHKDGSWRYFIERGKVVTGQNAQPLYIDGVIHDITVSKQIEQQREALINELEQKNAELERFTYTVSHDLKSPLITIKGFAGLIEDDARNGDPVQLKMDIHRITVAADTMQQLLADVLELSRIGRVVSPPENTSFGTLSHEAVELLAVSLAERGVSVEIAPDLPFVSVDHARILEVMVNLIENATKFMGDQEHPAIRIGVETDGPVQVFFVRDNGIGIDPRYLERIFNLFERLDTSTHGTGIGLTIVRRIIEVHGGKIWAESEGVGKGTTFKFTLPGPAEDDPKGMPK